MKESEEPNKLELGTWPLRSCSMPTPEEHGDIARNKRQNKAKEMKPALREKLC